MNDEIHHPSDVARLPMEKRPEAFAALKAYRGDRFQDSLGLRISAGLPLVPWEIDSLAKLLGYRCQERARRQLRATLERVPYILNKGIYERVLLEDGEAHYCAGQSYPDEIRAVRRLLR